MKLKNVSSSVIIVGAAIILPGQTVEVTDPAYQNNSAVEYFIKTKRLALVEDRPKKSKKV